MRRSTIPLIAVLLIVSGIALYVGARPTEYPSPLDSFSLSRWIAAFAITGGLVLFIRWARFYPSEAIAEEKFFIAPSTGSHQSSGIRKRVRERRRLPVLPHWPVYVVTILLLLLGFFMIFSGPAPNFGLRVSILQAAPNTAAQTTRTPNILLQVTCENRNAIYDLDGRIVPDRRLKYEIKQELAKQPDWIVYVKGDVNCEYQGIIDAVDIIRGLHARTVLVTDKTLPFLQDPARSASKK